MLFFDSIFSYWEGRIRGSSVGYLVMVGGYLVEEAGMVLRLLWKSEMELKLVTSLSLRVVALVVVLGMFMKLLRVDRSACCCCCCLSP